MEGIILFEPKPTEVTTRKSKRYIPFKVVTDAPISELRKPPTERGKRKILPPDVALRMAKRLLDKGMTAHAASQAMGFGKNYISNIRFRQPELYLEIIGE